MFHILYVLHKYVVVRFMFFLKQFYYHHNAFKISKNQIEKLRTSLQL